MTNEATRAQRRLEASGFRERWAKLGFKTRPAVANEIGVTDDAVKNWDFGFRPIPRYAWKALERLEK